MNALTRSGFDRRYKQNQPVALLTLPRCKAGAGEDTRSQRQVQKGGDSKAAAHRLRPETLNPPSAGCRCSLVEKGAQMAPHVLAGLWTAQAVRRIVMARDLPNREASSLGDFLHP